MDWVHICRAFSSVLCTILAFEGERRHVAVIWEEISESCLAFAGDTHDTMMAGSNLWAII